MVVGYKPLSDLLTMACGLLKDARHRVLVQVKDASCRPHASAFGEGLEDAVDGCIISVKTNKDARMT
jgi:hypothetical protein